MVVTADAGTVLSTPLSGFGRHGTETVRHQLSLDPWCALRRYSDAGTCHTGSAGRHVERGPRSCHSDRRFRWQPRSALRLLQRAARSAGSRSVSRLQHPNLAPLGGASVQGGSRGSVRIDGAPHCLFARCSDRGKLRGRLELVGRLPTTRTNIGDTAAIGSIGRFGPAPSSVLHRHAHLRAM